MSEPKASGGVIEWHGRNNLETTLLARSEPSIHGPEAKGLGPRGLLRYEGTCPLAVKIPCQYLALQISRRRVSGERDYPTVGKRGIQRALGHAGGLCISRRTVHWPNSR